MPDEEAAEMTEQESAETDEPEPTPQSEALRRQQLVVGAAVAAIAGVAVVIGGAQQFPSVPILLFVLVGMTTTAFLFMLLYTGIFPGEDG